MHLRYLVRSFLLIFLEWDTLRVEVPMKSSWTDIIQTITFTRPSLGASHTLD